MNSSLHSVNAVNVHVIKMISTSCSYSNLLVLEVNSFSFNGWFSSFKSEFAGQLAFNT